MRKVYANSRLTKSLPFHCTIDDGIYKPTYAPIVQKMFELRLQGMGAPKIAKELNNLFEAPPKIISGEFTQHIVHRILKDIAVTGTLVTRDKQHVPDYFPAAIDLDTFNRVNSHKPFKTGVITSTSGSANVLKGVAKCSACHSGVVMKLSGGRYRSLQCTKRTTGCVGSGKAVRVTEILPLILASMERSRWVLETYQNKKRSREKLVKLEEKKKLLAASLKTVSSKEAIDALSNEIEEVGLYMSFHQSLAKGSYANLLDSLDLSHAEGRKSFNLILGVVFSAIEVNFHQSELTLVHRFDDLTEKLPFNHQGLSPTTWGVKGLMDILLKEGTAIPKELETYLL